MGLGLTLGDGGAREVLGVGGAVWYGRLFGRYVERTGVPIFIFGVDFSSSSESSSSLTRFLPT